MDSHDDQVETLQPLLSAMLNDCLEPWQAAELGELLKVDPAARQQYLRQTLTHAMLQWINTSSDGAAQSDLPEEPRESPAANLWVQFPAIVLRTDRSASTGWSGGNVLVPYAISALIVVIGLFIASQSHLVRSDADRGSSLPVMHTTPGRSATSDSGPDLQFVARVTNAAACRWADKSTEAFQGEGVPAGHRYALASGLLEITYDSGTKIILQGPCTFEAASVDQGYLAHGKATVQAASMKLRSAKRGDESLHNRPPDSSSSPPAALFGVFAIRTPTALVTDLGTEFAVEVDKSGSSRAHVFQGQVDVRPVTEASEAAAMILRENESARVEVVVGAPVKIIREEGSAGHKFVRSMPKRVPIQFFGTGVGLKPGDTDPHWEVVASTSDKAFQTRLAVVFEPIRLIPRPGSKDESQRVWADGIWFRNDPQSSQWISLTQDSVPVGETVTFRTRFDLTGMVPESAAVEGRYIADDRVLAVRLNGHSWMVGSEPNSTAPFALWRAFRIPPGHFVAGVNCLEIDVHNTALASDPMKIGGYLAFRAELQGSAIAAAARFAARPSSHDATATTGGPQEK